MTIETEVGVLKPHDELRITGSHWKLREARICFLPSDTLILAL